MKIKVGNEGGFCNRLFAWDALYKIAMINNAELVCDWTELEHISLPNTTYQTNFDNYKPFNSNDIAEYDFILEDGFDYYATCGFAFAREIRSKNLPNKEITSQLHKICLNSSELQIKIQNTCKKVVGIHIRRGDYGDGKHNNFIPRCPHSIPDSWYLNIMTQLKELNSDVTFYLSSDGTDEELQIFYDKFNIINNKTIQPDDDKKVNNIIAHYPRLNRMISSLLNINLIKNITNNHARLNNLVHLLDKEAKGITHHDAQLSHLIDLFALSNCKLIICSVSTWSMVAYMLNNSPTIWPETQHQTLESLKQSKDTEFQKNIDIRTIL